MSHNDTKLRQWWHSTVLMWYKIDSIDAQLWTIQVNCYHIYLYKNTHQHIHICFRYFPLREDMAWISAWVISSDNLSTKMHFMIYNSCNIAVIFPCIALCGNTTIALQCWGSASFLCAQSAPTTYVHTVTAMTCCFSYITTALPYENAKNDVQHCVKWMHYSINVYSLSAFSASYYDLNIIWIRLS